MIPWKYVITTFVVGILLTFGFFSAANLHFQSLDFGITALKNIKAYEMLKDEERKLLFISELAKTNPLLNTVTLQDAVNKQLNTVKFDMQTLQTDAENKKTIAKKYENDARKIINYCLALTLFTLISLFVIEIYRIKEIASNQMLPMNFARISSFLFSNKNHREVFEPIFVDWQEEYFEALSKKEIWKARWINVRYTYAFLAAMWMKSPIGDLIEFFSKLAK